MLTDDSLLSRARLALLVAQNPPMQGCGGATEGVMLSSCASHSDAKEYDSQREHSISDCLALSETQSGAYRIRASVSLLLLFIELLLHDVTCCLSQHTPGTNSGVRRTNAAETWKAVSAIAELTHCRT